MITPMKKVTILTLASHKEETLKALREMEIIHLTPLQNAVGASVNGAKGAVARVQKAMEVVPDKLRKGVTPAAKGASGVTLVEEIQTLISDKKNAEIQLEQVLSSIETYGDVNAFKRVGRIRSWLSPHFSPKYSSGLPVRA